MFFAICVVSKVSGMGVEGKSPVLVSHAFCWLGLSIANVVKCANGWRWEHAAVMDDPLQVQASVSSGLSPTFLSDQNYSGSAPHRDICW